MKTKAEKEIAQQFDYVKQLLEDFQEKTLPLAELKGKMTTLENFNTYRKYFGVDEQDQEYTDKIIRMQLATKMVVKDEIAVAIYSINR